MSSDAIPESSPVRTSFSSSRRSDSPYPPSRKIQTPFSSSRGGQSPFSSSGRISSPFPPSEGRKSSFLSSSIEVDNEARKKAENTERNKKVLGLAAVGIGLVVSWKLVAAGAVVYAGYRFYTHLSTKPAQTVPVSVLPQIVLPALPPVAPSKTSTEIAREQLEEAIKKKDDFFEKVKRVDMITFYEDAVQERVLGLNQSKVIAKDIVALREKDKDSFDKALQLVFAEQYFKRYFKAEMTGSEQVALIKKALSEGFRAFNSGKLKYLTGSPLDKEDALNRILRTLAKKKNEDIESFSQSEKSLMKLVIDRLLESKNKKNPLIIALKGQKDEHQRMVLVRNALLKGSEGDKLEIEKAVRFLLETSIK